MGDVAIRSKERLQLRPVGEVGRSCISSRHFFQVRHHRSRLPFRPLAASAALGDHFLVKVDREVLHFACEAQ